MVQVRLQRDWWNVFLDLVVSLVLLDEEEEEDKLETAFLSCR